MRVDQELCKMHGWEQRKSTPEVWDAVIFSTELDLLEIRLNELDSVVDRFFIVESDSEFLSPSFGALMISSPRQKRSLVYQSLFILPIIGPVTPNSIIRLYIELSLARCHLPRGLRSMWKQTSASSWPIYYAHMWIRMCLLHWSYSPTSMNFHPHIHCIFCGHAPSHPPFICNYKTTYTRSSGLLVQVVGEHKCMNGVIRVITDILRPVIMY